MLRNRTAYKKLLHMDTTNEEEAAPTAGTAVLLNSTLLVDDFAAFVINT